MLDPLLGAVQTAAQPKVLRFPALLQTAAQRRAAILAITFAIAAFFRCLDLSAAGFSEDESNKLRAVQSYRHFDFTANAEHPMVMKLFVVASFSVADAWNRAAAPAHLPTIAPETALRLPNALAGAFMTVVMFLLVEQLFDFPTASVAALLWALDVNATAINRIGKEDTLLLLFFLLATWYYVRAKRQGRLDPAGAQRCFRWAGVSFGLMLASKYAPHFYGLHAAHVYAVDPHPGRNRPTPLPYYFTIAATFLIVNFAILNPATWRHLLGWVNGSTLEHTGYLFADRLYVNNVPDTPGGLPVYYYLAALATKVPIAVLVASGFGLVPLMLRRREPSFIFARMLLYLPLLGYSLVAGKFLRYLLPVFAAIDLVAAVGIVWMLRCIGGAPAGWLGSSCHREHVDGRLISAPLRAQLSATPYYSLYQNIIGSHLFPPGSLFPDDEFYDIGVREAVHYVARRASPAAGIASDVPGVVQEYLRKAGRPDIEAWSLARRGLPGRAGETWVLVQDGHMYFETEALIGLLRLQPPVYEFRVRGAVAVQIFRFPPDAHLGH